MVPAGDLIYRVQFKAPPAATQDVHGQPAGVETDLGTVWAKIEARPADESFAASEIEGLNEYLITVRRTATTAALATQHLCYLTSWGNLKTWIKEIRRDGTWDLIIRTASKP